jgi:ATP-dependent DNA helicase RecG
MGLTTVNSRLEVVVLLKMILGAVAKLSTPEVAPEVRKMLFVLKGEMTRKEIQQKLGLKAEKHFRTTYQQPAIVQGLIEMTIPDKPNSRLQKYRITPKGIAFVKQNQ